MGLYSEPLHSLSARQRVPVSRPQCSCCTRYWELRVAVPHGLLLCQTAFGSSALIASSETAFYH